MGTYTDWLELYKPDGTELVDAPTQLNRNLSIIDSRFKVVFDYFGTDVESILSSSLDKSLYSKYYRTLDNAIVVVDTFSTPPIAILQQDPLATIPSFVDFAFLNGWNGVPSFLSPIGSFIEKSPLGIAQKIRLTGNIRLNAADPIVEGTIYTVGTTLNPPATTKHFIANCDTNNSIVNINVAPTGNITLTRFGSAQVAGSGSNLVSLGGIEWSVV